MRSGLYGLLLTLFIVSTPAIADIHPVRHAINFRLMDDTDTSWELYRFVESPLILIAAHSTSSESLDDAHPKWEAIRSEHEDLRFFYLNATTSDSRASLAEWSANVENATPILKDTVQAVARQMGLQHTGDVAIVRPSEDWAVVWRGSIARPDQLKKAINALISGDAIPEFDLRTALAPIDFEAPGDVQYARDVAPILQERCVSCHSEGSTGPFAMSSYKKVKGWAEMIEEVVLTKRMPPWHADPAYGHFLNGMAMTADQERTLLSWLEAGAPKTEEEPDPLVLAAASDSSEGWALGAPDHISAMPQPFDLPATGIVDYQYIHVPSGLTEDKWVRALEVRAGNKAVVHHALIFVLYPPEYQHIQPRPGEGLNGYFASFLPGAEPRPYPEGTGQFLPAGSTFIFQMHYTTTGKPERDLTQMGLYFHDEPPAEALQITAVAESELRIPPRERDVEVRKQEKFNKPIKVWGLSPHMHYRGSRFRFAAEPPKGDETTLLNVPYYEFDWQPMYRFAEAYELPKGSRIRTVGAFDNSATNPRNPDPDKYVRFGRQSFEEMYIGYVMYSEQRDPERYIPMGERTATATGEGEMLTAETLVDTKWRAGGFRMHFMEDGRFVSVAFGGKWRVEGNMVYVTTGDRVLSAAIMGDKLFYNGRPLTRFD